MVKPFNSEHWKGRVDVEDGVAGKRWHQLIKEFPKGHQAYLDKSVVFLGFASDEGVRRNKGRTGAAKAPKVIRKYLSQLPRMKSDVSALYDYGNVVCVGTDLEKAREEQISIVSELLHKKTYPIVLGGGHEVAYGNFHAMKENYKDIGIINIDAHLDMRLPNPQINSGTGFYEMAQSIEEENFNYLCLGAQKVGNTQALFDRAVSLGGKYILADEIHENHKDWHNILDDFLNKHKHIYLSLDMDVFDVVYAPGASATTTNGLNPHQVKLILHKIMKSKKVKLVDVAELNPEYDIDDRTAKLAAHMVSEIVHNI